MATENIVLLLVVCFFLINVQYVSFCCTKEWISYYVYCVLSSVQSLSHVYLWPYGLQHTRLFHCISDAIQPCHPLSFPSPPAFNLSQHQGLFQWVSSSYQVAKVLEISFSISRFNELSGLISFRIDQFDSLGVQGTVKISSNTTVQKHQFFGPQLSLWYNSHTHNDWKNHRFDYTDFCQ